jgi:hypothetical protein
LLHDDALALAVGAGRPALALEAPLVHAEAARPVCVEDGAGAGWYAGGAAGAGAGAGWYAGAGAGAGAAAGGGAAGWPTRVADVAWAAACACWRLRGDE